MQVLDSYINSSFLSWDKGSTLIFWRWNPELQTIARDGFKPYIFDKLPTNRKRPRPIPNEQKDIFFSKLKKFIIKTYIERESKFIRITNKVDYFAVPKGDTDIRPVFNGTSCGLNDVLFAPKFWLPTSDSFANAITFDYQMVDIDLGEMFDNFPLHETMQATSGLDLSPFREQIKKAFPDHVKGDEPLLYRWTRDWMGLKLSPFWSAKYFYLMEGFILGHMQNPGNAFYWDRAILNLPGDPTFNPSLPFVFKYDAKKQRIAAALKAYVDELRIAAATLNLAWVASRQTASRIQYLGSQDAPRKRRVDKGPWTGTIFDTENGSVTKTVTLEKWNKAKGYLETLNKLIATDPNVMVDFKLLERIRGFLCHLAMTFNIIFPYLKGFHLTLCQHLPKRDESGWKMSDLEWIGHVESLIRNEKINEEEKEHMLGQLPYSDLTPPKLVKLLLRFHACLGALNQFFSDPTPPLVHMRSDNVLMAVYGFLDASGTGFGSTIEKAGEISFRMGVWGKDQENESSNWREFENLVQTLESEAQSGNLDGALLVLAVDNSTVESCIFKGNSSSEKLFNLILRFKDVELKTGARFIVSHVSGERMKHQGTDGFSRGTTNEGIGLAGNMLSFCPWHLNALKRSEFLKVWISSWVGNQAEFLEPSDWFVRGHDICGYYKDERVFGGWR